jgi:hypothetical protein
LEELLKYPQRGITCQPAGWNKPARLGKRVTEGINPRKIHARKYNLEDVEFLVSSIALSLDGLSVRV